ncbi:MAG: multidrug transporter, partial [Thermoprotei archaeon]
MDLSVPRVAVILAAGHGKRLKSNIPKMLFEIWGVPTILRVIQSAREGFKTPNQIIVVGQKWEKVVETVGKEKN